MRLTSVYQASAAAFGLLAGFAMTPQAPSPLERAVTPYAVQVAWGPAPISRDDAMSSDDWYAGMTRAQAAEHHARAAEHHARMAEAAAARKSAADAARGAAKSTRRKAETTKPFAPKMDFVTSTFGVPKRECPRETGSQPQPQPRVS